MGQSVAQTLPSKKRSMFDIPRQSAQPRSRTVKRCIAARAALIDDLVSAGQQRQRERETKCLRTFQIEHQLDLYHLNTGRSDGFAPWRMRAF